MNRKEELEKRLALNSLKNRIKFNLPSFTLLKIHENNDNEFAYYKEQIERFQLLWKKEQLPERITRTQNKDEHYYEWILTEIPDINDNDKWLITGRYSYGYWAEVKSGDKYNAIKELWHKDKDIDGRERGYTKGFFAINESIGLVIQVGCFLGIYDRGYNPEYHYTLTTLKI